MHHTAIASYLDELVTRLDRQIGDDVMSPSCGLPCSPRRTRTPTRLGSSVAP